MRSRFTLAAVAGLALSACTAAELTEPRLAAVSADAVGDRDNYTTHEPETVRACAFFGDEQSGPAARFVASAPAGEDVLSGEFAIQPRPYCIEVWNATHDGNVPVTVSMVNVDAGWEIKELVVATGDGESHTTYDRLPPAMSATVTANRALGGFIWFKFQRVAAPPPPTDTVVTPPPPPPPPPTDTVVTPPPPPPPPPPPVVEGGEGCTAIFWRQKRHHDSWPAPYTPKTRFNAVFRNAFPGKTLGEVLALRGGGEDGLGRAAVAALLNAASSDVSYDLSVARVIDGFNTASRGSKRAVRNEKHLFQFLNQQGCPLR